MVPKPFDSGLSGAVSQRQNAEPYETLNLSPRGGEGSAFKFMGSDEQGYSTEAGLHYLTIYKQKHCELTTS